MGGDCNIVMPMGAAGMESLFVDRCVVTHSCVGRRKWLKEILKGQSKNTVLIDLLGIISCNLFFRHEYS